jgi:cytochrome c553
MPHFRILSAVAAALLAAPAPLAALHAETGPGRAKAEMCFACHGPEGHSATGEVPTLAAQPRPFVATQLHLFRDGGRKDAQMAPMTVNLTDADIDDIAVYFSTVPPAPPENPSDPSLTAAAQKLIERNHCTACHGATLAGRAQAPRLAGQQRAYIAWQLKAYRDGKRTGVDGSMRQAVKPLSNKDINLLADYVSRLAAP